MKVARIFFAMTVGVYCATTMPRLLSSGMFLDGETFASVSRNMAEGVGTAWKPYYTDFIFPVEIEHLPVAFWLQSVAFRLFGDLPFIESVYGFFLGLLCLFLMAGIWREMRHSAESAWLPALMFVSVPICSWAFANNILENTITTLALLAAYSFVFGLRSPTLAIFGGTFAGILTVGAALAKGPPGAFVALLPLAALVSERHRVGNVVKASLSMGFAVAALSTLIFLHAPARELLHLFYWKKMLYVQVSGTDFGFRSHFFRTIPLQLAVPGILALLCYVYAGRPTLTFKGSTWFFALLALAGSAPFIATGLLDRYTLPSLPFYMLAIGSVFESSTVQTVKNLAIRRVWLLLITVSLYTGSVVGMLAERGRIRRDPEIHADLDGLRIAPRAIIDVCPATKAFDWSLLAYMQRTYKSSLTSQTRERYTIIWRDACPVAPGCRILNAHASEFKLYDCDRNGGVSP